MTSIIFLLSNYRGIVSVLIESLKVFCDLVDTQNFTKTAALNSVTQSAVSQQIKNIEKRQGKQLLEREKRQISLTAEGEIFYRYAREILRRYEEMLHRIQALEGVVSGTVRLSAIYTVGMLEMGPYIKSYLKMFPRINLHLEYNQAQQVYDDVASGEVDLGIVAYPRPQRNIEVIPFTRDQLVVICHPEHPWAGQESVSIKDLDKVPFITFTEETPTRQALDQLFRKHRAHPQLVMELDHIATIKNAVEVDLGVSVVPAPAVEQEINWGTLKALALEGEALFRPLGILHRQGRSLSIATQKLIEVLTEGKNAASGTQPDEAPAEGVGGRKTRTGRGKG